MDKKMTPRRERVGLFFSWADAATRLLQFAVTEARVGHEVAVFFRCFFQVKQLVAFPRSLVNDLQNVGLRKGIGKNEQIIAAVLDVQRRSKFAGTFFVPEHFRL